MNLTFEQLPQVVMTLTEEVRELRKLFLEPQPQQETDKFLTIQETADFLNLSVPTIYSKVQRRQLPYMKQGKRLYFSKTELTEYIEQGRKKTVSEIESEALSYLAK